MRIRRARLSDLEPLVQLERLFPSDGISRRGFRRLLSGTSAEVWVCASGARVIGNAVVLYRRGTTTARLYSLIVDPADRGRGIAKRLLRQLESAAQRRRCTALRLEVRSDNRGAIALYEASGYRLRARAPHYYDDGSDALRWEKLLGKKLNGLRARA